MNKVVINIKTDAEVKDAAQALAEDLGLTLSALINAQLKQLIYNRRIVLNAPYPTLEVDVETSKNLTQVYKEIKAGQVSKPFNKVDDFLKDLKTSS